MNSIMALCCNQPRPERRDDADQVETRSLSGSRKPEALMLIGTVMTVLCGLLPALVAAQQRFSDPATENKELIVLNGKAAKDIETRVSRDANYVIGPMDVLEVTVWKEPDVSRTVAVRPDGRISLPLLNDVEAAGLTPTELASHITDGLKKFMTPTQVTVIVAAPNSQRIYIIGEVTRAGGYPLLPGMTVLQALSDAGGFTPFANIKNICVLRQENGKQMKYAFNYKAVSSGKNPEQNLVLKADDTIVVR